jgi:hypothetical protein
MDDLPARVTALEQWRITFERLNEMQFASIREGQATTNRHLTQQDEATGKQDKKLDRLAEGMEAISLKLAGLDGATLAMDKVSIARANESSARRQQIANYVAIASVVVAAIAIVAGLYWGHQF